MRALLDLVLPLACGGCARGGTRWCDDCAAVLADEPRAVVPRVPGAGPAWAVCAHGGAGRSAVVAAKERGRRDLAGPLGRGVAGALTHLREWGELDPALLAPLWLVPAPSRPGAARRRGGDAVAAMTLAAARELARAEPTAPAPVVWPGARLGRGARDSVGLGAAARQANLAGRVHVRPGPRPPPGACVVVVDDVLTTGATVAALRRALAGAGVRVAAAVVVTAVG